MPRRLLAVLRIADPVGVEILTGIAATGWGAWAVIFPVYAASPTYRILATAISQPVIAALALGAGLGVLWAARRGAPEARCIATFLTFVLFGTLGALFLLANVSAQGGLTYSILALGDGWASWRLARMAAHGP